MEAGDFFYEFALEGSDDAWISLEMTEGGGDDVPAGGGDDFGDLMPLPGPDGDLPPLDPGLDPGGGDGGLPLPDDSAGADLPPVDDGGGDLPPVDGGGDDLPPLDGGDLPPLDGGDLPPLDGGGDLLPLDPGAPVDDGMGAVDPGLSEEALARERIQYFGEPGAVDIEEMGDVYTYVEVSTSKPLRFEIQGPGSLYIGVRAPLGRRQSMASMTVMLNVDGTDIPPQEMELASPPEFANSTFVSGGPKKKKPSTEEGFALEIGPGSVFCEIKAEGDSRVAYLLFKFTPSEEPPPGEAVVKRAPTLLNEEEIARLQEQARAALKKGNRRANAWRIALELFGGTAVPLALSNPGLSGRLGFQLTPPWLGGWLGLSLAGGVAYATGKATTDTVMGWRSATVEVARTRLYVPVDLGLHAYFDLSRTIRFQVEGGGSLTYVDVTQEALNHASKVSGITFGVWGGMRFGFVTGPGVMFLSGRYGWSLPVETAAGTVQPVVAVGEIGYAFEL